MALIEPNSTCAICAQVLNRPYTATSGVAFASDHRLWRYCDAPLHLHCLADWVDRAEFSREYFLGSLHGYWSGHGTLLSVSPDWFLACGPSARGVDPYFVEARLAAWPFRLYSESQNWNAYVAAGFRERLAGPALDAAENIMAQVREQVPSLDSLRTLLARRAQDPGGPRSLVDFGNYLTALLGDAAPRTDWAGLEQQHQKNAETRVEQERVRAEALNQSNELSRRLAIELAGGGLTCPHCRRRTREMRFVDKSPAAASYFVCGLCGRSFAGSESAAAGVPPTT
jgi:hypothetical protein